MNYFAALLLAAGLPTSMTSMAGASTPAITYHATPALIVPAVVPAPLGVATVYQAYQTMITTYDSALMLTKVAGHSTRASSTSSVASTAHQSNVARGAKTMIAMINQARVKAGLSPYTVNAKLMTLAQERAKALTAGPFTSDLPLYGWPAQMEQSAGIHAQGLGAENIAQASSVRQAFGLLMASPPHRANILNPYETQIGVGVYSRGSGVAISELFIGPNT